MGIIETIKNRIDDGRIKRTLGVLKMIEERYQYNAYKVYMPESLLVTSKINDTLIESLVWYSGDVSALLDLYKKNSRYEHMRGAFWNMVGDYQRKIHSGLPNLIVSKMPTIIFGAGYKIYLTIYNGDVVDEAMTLKVNELSDLLIEQLDLKNKFMSGAEKESWSGHLGSKISIAPGISKLPIPEFFDRRYFDIHKTRGITKGIEFKKYFTIANGEYIIREVYTVEDNHPVIQYSVSMHKEGKEIPISIQSAREYLEDLQGIEMDETGRVVYSDLTGSLAFEKPNSVQKNIINENPYGKSDITAFTSYDALDEIMTQLVQEIRDNRTRVYIPESMIRKDDKGNFIKFDAMITNFITLAADPDQNAKNQVTSTYIQDKTNDHYLKYKTLISNVCNQSELSPISLGVVGLDGLNNGQETLRERVKTTIEMRDKKCELWKDFLKKFMKQLILTYDYMAKSGGELIGGYGHMGLKEENLDCDVIFNDYMSSSQKELIDTWTIAKTNGLASIDMGVRKIHQDDLTEEQKIEEINLIRFENGMSVETPETLNLTPEETK